MIQIGVCIEKSFREEASKIFDVSEQSWIADRYVEDKMNNYEPIHFILHRRANKEGF